LDSRLILATIKNNSMSQSIRPVTYSQKKSYEYLNARKVCSTLNVSGHVLAEITPDALVDRYLQALWLNEGYITMTNAHLLIIPTVLERDYTCLLNGIYGGPTNYSAEYNRKDHISMTGNINDKVQDILKVISLDPSKYHGALGDKLFEEVNKNWETSIRLGFQKHIDVSEKFCDQRDAFFIENRMRRYIVQGSIYKFYWEEQLPLSDYGMYKNYLTIPPEYKLHRKLLKNIIMRKFPDLGLIPDSNTGLKLFETPGTIYNIKNKVMKNIKWYTMRISKGKVGFIDRTGYADYDLWFRSHKPTNRKIKEILFSHFANELGLVQNNRLISLIERVESGREIFLPLIRLATIVAWAGVFLDGNGVRSLQESLKTRS
jgi:hypothetical protein